MANTITRTIHLCSAIILSSALILVCARTARSDELYMYQDSVGSFHFSNAPTDPTYQRYVLSGPQARVETAEGVLLRQVKAAFDASAGSGSGPYIFEQALQRFVSLVPGDARGPASWSARFNYTQNSSEYSGQRYVNLTVDLHLSWTEHYSIPTYEYAPNGSSGTSSQQWSISQSS